jgi:hypothetical protein
MTATALKDLANVIRSKNAGPFLLTLDVFFRDAAAYEKTMRSSQLDLENIAKLYDMPKDKVLSACFFEPALGWKATLIRPTPSGAFGDSDVYGSQQHIPLLQLMIR